MKKYINKLKNKNKKGSAFNNPDKTDYQRETEPGEKKTERFCLQIATAQIGLTT